MRHRLIVIGIGGASCSGKTLLAKHIRNILPKGTEIIHQDDFCPPIEKVPYAKKYPDIQDWDDPPTAILWPEFRQTLAHIRKIGTVPEKHLSHDHLNKQVEVQIEHSVRDRWRVEFQKFQAEMNGEGVEVTWVLVDGFILYWDMEAVKHLDIRIFLRVPHNLLKQRRDERQTYVLQNPDDAAAGGVWVDPPNYFEQIVYPAYIKAHEGIFERGDVEAGEVKEEWGEGGKRLEVLRPLEGAEEMTRVFGEGCEAILKGCREGRGCFL